MLMPVVPERRIELKPECPDSHRADKGEKLSGVFTEMYREYPGLWGSIIINQSTVVSFWSCCHSTNNKIGKNI